MSLFSRRDFLKSTTAAAGVATMAHAANSSAQERSADRPNLLFILADQWRFSAFGHGTDEVIKTPHIDQLASEGINFERAYAANPVCTPNRSCLLTGRHSHQHGMIKNDLMLPPNEVCWPQLFKDAGYATHYIGKWHMDGVAKPGFVPPGWRRRGFDTFEGFNRGHVYHEVYGFDNDGNPIEKAVEHLPDPYYEPILQTDLAMRFMEQRRNQPFCCYLSWGPPHTPFKPPQKFDRYKAEDIRLRPNVPEKHRQQAIRDLTGYYGLCESLDHQMGRLMTFLKKSGLEENTLIVFSADHGELAGSHGKYRKGEPEEESLHVPLIMRKPGMIPAGTKSQVLFNSIDIMPTILSLCGVKDPGTCTGTNLAAEATQDEPAPKVESIYCEGKLTSADEEGNVNRRRRATAAENQAWRTIVTQQYKLTVRGNWNTVESLYDLSDDPFEMTNLANQKRQRTVQSELLASLQDEAKRTGDTFPMIPESAKAMYSDEEAARA